MPLYNTRGSNLPQAAQSAMSSATNAMANQTKQTTIERREKTSFWDDLYKGARAVQAGAGAINSIVDTAGDAVDLYDNLKIKSAYNNIAEAFGKGGYAAIQDNPDMQDYWHSQALGKFVKDRASSQQGYLDMLKKSGEAADRLYQDWRIQAMSVADAYQKGDMEGYMNGMTQLVASSPMPYRLEADGNGNFRELFRSDEKGGWTETGRTISAQEAYEQMNGILKGEQMILRGTDMKLMPANAAFIQAAQRYKYATMMGNAENRLDPKKQIPLYDRNGNQAGIAVIQNPLDDYSAGPKLFAYGRNGRQIGIFDGYDQAMQYGLSPYNPVAGKGGRRGGGGGSAGSAASGTYAVKDSARFSEYATKMNPDTGEKEIDYAIAAFLEDVQRQTGRTGNAVIAAFDQNVKAAMQNGMNREQAEQAAMAGMAQRINGVAQHGAGVQPQDAQAQADNTSPQQAENPNHERIRRAASGTEGSPVNSKENKADAGVARGINGAIPQEVPANPYMKDLGSIGAAQDLSTRAFRGIGASFKNADPGEDKEDIFDYRP